MDCIEICHSYTQIIYILYMIGNITASDIIILMIDNLTLYPIFPIVEHLEMCKF